MLKAPQRQVAPIVAVVVALSVGGIGIAQGSSHSSPQLAKEAKAKKKKKKKKNHVVSSEYKSDLTHGSGLTDQQDTARLVGKPFGNRKVHLDEVSVLTFNQPDLSLVDLNNDYSGTTHTSFHAFYAGTDSSFTGFYDYSRDWGSNPTGPVTGVITGGRGTFKGATGSFRVLDLSTEGGESGHRYTGHWQGSIRY